MYSGFSDHVCNVNAARVTADIIRIIALGLEPTPAEKTSN